MGEADYLKTVAKAIDVINLFAFSKSRWGPRDLARELGIDKSSALRILLTLRDKKWLVYDESSGKYLLGPELLGMAIAVQSRNTLTELARPVMLRYVKNINETLTLFSYNNDEMIFESSIDTDHSLRFKLKLGEPYPLHVGVSGKVVLANLPEEAAEGVYRRFEEDGMCDVAVLREQVALCKKNGYATAHGERVQGMRGFAAPIYGIDHVFLGGINLALPEARYKLEDHDRYCQAVVDCARDITYYFDNQLPPTTGSGQESS